MIEAGSVLCVSDEGFRHILADAVLLADGKTLWFFVAFGQDQSAEHWISFARAEDDGYYINFYAAEDGLLATLSPLENSEDLATWAEWQKFTTTPEGRTSSESIAWLRHRALTWDA